LLTKSRRDLDANEAPEVDLSVGRLQSVRDFTLVDFVTRKTRNPTRRRKRSWLFRHRERDLRCVDRRKETRINY